MPHGYTVPVDFPRPQYGTTLPGAAPKFNAVKFEGKFYPAGRSPPELHERWEYCEELAHQFKDSSLLTKAGKRSHMSEIDILEQYQTRLLETDWGTVAELKWIIRRAADLLGWPKPPNSLES